METYDERLTTRMAASGAPGRARQGADHRDSLAAAHLLSRYLARAARGGGQVADEQDWFADTEGNLTAPGEATG